MVHCHITDLNITAALTHSPRHLNRGSCKSSLNLLFLKKKKLELLQLKDLYFFRFDAGLFACFNLVQLPFVSEFRFIHLFNRRTSGRLGVSYFYVFLANLLLALAFKSLFEAISPDLNRIQFVLFLFRFKKSEHLKLLTLLRGTRPKYISRCLKIGEFTI